MNQNEETQFRKLDDESSQNFRLPNPPSGNQSIQAQPPLKDQDIPQNIPKSRTPVLDHFGSDLNRIAEEGKLMPTIARDIEIDLITQVFTRKQLNNAILVGESGVGKTKIIEGLALKIMERKINRLFFNKRILTIDYDNLTNEERVNAIIHELNKNRDVILVLEQIDVIFGPESIIDKSLVKIFKKALSQNEFQCIATVESDKYKYIENDKVLNRLFQKIPIKELSATGTFDVLKSIKYKYEEFHNVTYSIDSLQECVALSERFILDRFFPEKSIQIMDQVGALIHVMNTTIVPKRIENLENEIDMLKEQKNSAVRNAKYEEAGFLRDQESKLSKILDFEKAQWEETSRTMKYPVTKIDVQMYFQKHLNINLDEPGKTETLTNDIDHTQFLKDKIAEYDLNNKASIKIKDVPNRLKTNFQQYLLYFKDYLENVKGKSIYFEVTKIDEGLRIDIDPSEIEDFEQFDNWFNEYMNFIKVKSDKINIVFEKDTTESEAVRVIEEVKNQIDFLEKQMILIQPGCNCGLSQKKVK